MAKFDFRLQRVLDIREVELEKAQNELYKEKQKEKRIKKKLDKNNEELLELFDYMRNTNLTVTENVQVRRYINNQKKKIKTIEQRYVNQQKIVKKTKSKLLKRKKNKEKLVNLKDKEFEEFKKDFLKKEQKEIDELSLRMITQEG